LKISLNSQFKNAHSTTGAFLKSLILVTAIACTLCLAACSDNSDNVDAEQTDDVTGIWFGQATTVEGDQENVVLAIAPGGTAVLFAEESLNMFLSNGVVSSNEFTSEDTMYYPRDGMTRYGSVQASADDGKLDGVAHLSGSVIEFSATKLVAQDTISLRDIAGNYSRTSTDEFSTYTLSVAIDDDGMISGSNSVGCLYSGNVEPVAGINALFNVSIKVESCYEDLDYHGLLAFGVFPFNYDGAINEREGIVIVSEDESRAYPMRLFSPQN